MNQDVCGIESYHAVQHFSDLDDDDEDDGEDSWGGCGDPTYDV